MRIPIQAHPVKRIFISYRRHDSLAITGRIQDRLAAAFGQKTVYRDLDSIPAGVDFRDHLHNALADCGTMVVIIGPDWTGQGRNRLLEPGDHVRHEVATALERRIHVVPVLVAGGKLPATDDLPEELHGLRQRNATTVDQGIDFDVHMERLIANIKQSARLSPAASKPKPVKEEIPPFPITLSPSNAARWYLLPLCWAMFGALAALISAGLLRLIVPHGREMDPRDVLHVLAAVVPLGAALYGCGAVVARRSLASHDTWSAALIFQLVAFVAGLLTLRIGPAFGWGLGLTSASVTLVVAMGQFTAWHPVLNSMRGVAYIVAFPCMVFGLHLGAASALPLNTFGGQLLWTLVVFALMGFAFTWATSGTQAQVKATTA
jgi:hypothetical protein